MKIKLFGGVLVAALAFTSLADAQIVSREHNHAARINQGVRTGELTHKETRKLVKRENKVRKAIRKSQADGYVSPKERKHILRKQGRVNRAIIRKKTNGRTQ